MVASLQDLARLLESSLDARQSKQAEAAIRQQEQQAGFTTSLLQIVSSESYPLSTRLASSLCFKNFVKRNWTDDEGNHKIAEAEVITIKREIIGLMIALPPSLQLQLGEAISVIANSEFWEKWDTLVDDLVSRLSPDNAVINNSVLQVAHSIFKRWRPMFQSDDLYIEINHVLSKFCKPFLALLEKTDAAITRSQTDPTHLKQYFMTMNLILKLFFDLSCHDLPPDFEENLPAIATMWHKYLVYDNNILHTDDDSESGLLEYAKTGIFELLILYVNKYEEDFNSLLPQFIESSWNLLTTVGLKTKYDILVSKALLFLRSIIPNHSDVFKNEEILAQVIEKVILPNISLRDSDMERFEDEPIEFVRRELEGSDSETRQRAATDFLSQLVEKFEQLITTVVSKYMNYHLEEYAKNKSQNWKSKNTAVFLFSSIASKGSVTVSHGVLTLNPSVDILEFFQKNIADDLTMDSVHPITRIDAMKFLHTFRNHIAPHYWNAAFPLLVRHLGSSNLVVYTYAAVVLERALFVTDSQRQPIIPKNDVTALSQDLLQHLFALIQKDSAPEKIQENEFLMRCIMRVLIVIKDDASRMTDLILRNFIKITSVIRQNPSNPRFYYYLFEGISAFIRFAPLSLSKQLETALFNPFATILQSEVHEFMPYVFQLLAALLESNPSGTLTEYYQSLVRPILMPPLWESKGNTPALVRLLSAILLRGADKIVQNNQVEPILGIFQKLVSKKTNEIYGFDLLDTVIDTIPVTVLRGYFVPMLQIMLTRLSDSNTTAFTMRFVRFYHLVSTKDDNGLGVDFFINVMDQVKADVFKPVYLNFILPNTRKLPRPFDRKTAIVAFTKTLGDSQAFVDRYPKGWTLTCQALLDLLVNPPEVAPHDDIIPDQDVNDACFGVGFTPLNTSRRPLNDPFPAIKDVKKWVGQYLKDSDVRHGGRIRAFIEQLSESQREQLMACMPA